jgi:hypothetical protein
VSQSGQLSLKIIHRYLPRKQLLFEIGSETRPAWSLNPPNVICFSSQKYFSVSLVVGHNNYDSIQRVSRCLEALRRIEKSNEPFINFVRAGSLSSSTCPDFDYYNSATAIFFRSYRTVLSDLGDVLSDLGDVPPRSRSGKDRPVLLLSTPSLAAVFSSKVPVTGRSLAF